MIRIGIAGYGNLGRGTIEAVKKATDMKLCALFSRRDPETLKTDKKDLKVYSLSDAYKHKDEIDVLIICGGSATDLPQMTPALARDFNVIDSFDTHANISEHFKAVDEQAKIGGNIAFISVGWDPGMFSLNRLYSSCILPDGQDYTFWGRGVSQGHSDAIRRIPGVIDARQYTVPVPDAVARVKNGENPILSVRDKHTRECYVVASDDADKEKIRQAIVTMPNYFSDYDTTVNFISAEEMKKNHSGLPHGGSVIRTGKTGDGTNSHVIEYSLRLDSNPEFTGSVLTAFARAAHKMKQRGIIGCKTVFDIAPCDLSILSDDELRSHIL